MIIVTTNEKQVCYKKFTRMLQTKVFKKIGDWKTSISMKEGSLFVLFCFVCIYGIHRTRMLQIVFLVSLESSRRGGLHGLDSMTFGLAVQKFLNIE